jgi:rhamnose utilization protein RhaD (predicted bifunctional aldolase and dehydrogenase)
LARGIAERRRADTDVLVLGNHGLVVAADTVAGAEDLLSRVCRRLARPVRPAPAADRSELARLADTRYRPAAQDATHAVATDPASLAIAEAGSYYPDHVIFLGHGAPVLQPGETADDLVIRFERAGQGAPAWILAPGAGVLLRADAGEAAEAMARCLADVAARIRPETALDRLTLDDVGALLNWDAEKYRQTLERQRAGGAS